MSKNVRFDYFKVWCRRYDELQERMVEEPCNLNQVLDQASAFLTRERIYIVGEDTARLQEIEFINNIWELHFIRIRKSYFPVKTHDNGEYGFFDDFEEEEGIGEEVSALYDPDNYILMLRRNMFSLSPSSIANFLSGFINTPGFSIILKPLVHPDALQLLKEGDYIRSAEITVADIKNANQETKRALGQITAPAEEIEETVNLTVRIGLAQKGATKESKIPIYRRLLGLLEDDKVKKLEVSKKESPDAAVEKCDLVQHRLYEFYRFEEAEIDTESRNIRHATVVRKMRILYERKAEEINSVYV